MIVYPMVLLLLQRILLTQALENMLVIGFQILKITF